MFFGVGAPVATVHMYRGADAMIEGWTRILAGALSRRQIAISWAVTMFGFAPYIVLAALLVRGLFDTTTLVFGGLAIAHLVLATWVNWYLWEIVGCSRRWLWYYPVALASGAWVLARAWWRLTTGYTFSWRDTRYRVNREGRISTAVKNTA